MKTETSKKTVCRQEGLGMASARRCHQMVIDQFVAKFHMLYPQKWHLLHTNMKAIDIPSRPGSAGQRFPDISYWERLEKVVYDFKIDDVGLRNILFLVEVLHFSTDKWRTKKKINYIFEKCPTLIEAFIYDFRKKKWTRLVRCFGEILCFEDADYCEVLDMHLNDILNYEV